MNTQIQPVIIVSKCLGFENCRYDGQIISSPFVENLKKFVQFKPVCPEMEIGLGVPRNPINIVLKNGQSRLFQPATGRDVTDLMHTFIRQYMKAIGPVDGFILKNRSPSCGIRDVKIFTGFHQPVPAKKGSGFFGSAVLESYPNMPIEDEGRLINFKIREHFLTKLFTFFRFQKAKTNNKMNALIQFHTDHKLLLLAYNQSRYRVCGRIVANHKRTLIENVLEQYEQELKLIFRKIPRYSSIINTLLHMFGGISRHLSKQERQFFLKSIEAYQEGRIPLSTLNHLIHAYVIRFNNTYLLNQVFLNPYPKELITITDSGKGRNQ
jgi:uncharacterized protein YbgA (DUF1722 family)/uncharacterized protein YbbK (DUF523 family)